MSCGGASGISNTFASALWATDYITQAMAAGAAGINLQGNPGNCFGYTPVCADSEERLARGELTPQPVWYALLLTKALIGSRPLRTLVSSPGSPNIAVRSLRAPDGTLRFVIVDDDPPGSPAAAVALQCRPTLPRGERALAHRAVAARNRWGEARRARGG